MLISYKFHVFKLSLLVNFVLNCFRLLLFHYYLQVGDPLEKAALKGIDWSYKSDEKAMPKRFVGSISIIV